MPSNQVSLARKVQKAIPQLEQVHERQPSMEELSSEPNMKEELWMMGDYNRNYESLDVPSRFKHEKTMDDNPKDASAESANDNLQHTVSTGIEIRRCLNTLGKRKNVPYCFFDIGMPDVLTVWRLQ